MPEGKFFIAKVKEQKTFGADSGTETIDLPASNYLAGLLLRVQNTNGATSNTGGTITGDIDKIEITADGVVIFSMTGEMARNIAHFSTVRAPDYNETQEASKVQYATFPIMFGRSDNDKNIILPAHMFSTLQLKVQYSFTDSGTTGYTTSESNAKIDVLAKYLVSNERVNTPFLKKIEHYSKTPSSTGSYEADLPVGAGNGAYRRLFLYSYEASVEPETDVNKYEVLVNDSQRIIDQRMTTSLAEDAWRYGVIGDKTLVAYVAAASATTGNFKVPHIKGAFTTAMDSNGPDLVVSFDSAAVGDKLTFDSEDTAGLNVATHIVSDGVPNTTAIDFGTDDIKDSLNVGAGSGVSSLKVKYNEAATGNTVRIVGEQLVQF